MRRNEALASLAKIWALLFCRFLPCVENLRSEFTMNFIAFEILLHTRNDTYHNRMLVMGSFIMFFAVKPNCEVVNR